MRYPDEIWSKSYTVTQVSISEELANTYFIGVMIIQEIFNKFTFIDLSLISWIPCHKIKSDLKYNFDQNNLFISLNMETEDTSCIYDY